MPLPWIAARLNMGSRGHLAGLLQQHKEASEVTLPKKGCSEYDNLIN